MHHKVMISWHAHLNIHCKLMTFKKGKQSHSSLGKYRLFLGYRTRLFPLLMLLRIPPESYHLHWMFWGELNENNENKGSERQA